MATPSKFNPDLRARDTRLSPDLRTHLFIVGASLFVVGSAVSLLLPELAWWWVLVVAVAHAGLFMVVGATILRWIAGRRVRIPM